MASRSPVTGSSAPDIPRSVDGQPQEVFRELARHIFGRIRDYYGRGRKGVTPYMLAWYYRRFDLSEDALRPFRELFEDPAVPDRELREFFRGLGAELKPQDPGREEQPELTEGGFCRWLQVTALAYPGQEAERLGRVSAAWPVPDIRDLGVRPPPHGALDSGHAQSQSSRALLWSQLDQRSGRSRGARRPGQAMARPSPRRGGRGTTPPPAASYTAPLRPRPRSRSRSRSGPRPCSRGPGRPGVVQEWELPGLEGDAAWGTGPIEGVASTGGPRAGYPVGGELGSRTLRWGGRG